MCVPPTISNPSTSLYNTPYCILHTTVRHVLYRVRPGQTQRNVEGEGGGIRTQKGCGVDDSVKRYLISSRRIDWLRRGGWYARGVAGRETKRVSAGAKRAERAEHQDSHGMMQCVRGRVWGEEAPMMLQCSTKASACASVNDSQLTCERSVIVTA